MLLAALAAATRRGEYCALIDACDALDPHSIAAAGVDLDRLLWVRCGVRSPLKAEPAQPSRLPLPEKYFVAPPARQGLHGGSFGPHPRCEQKGLSDAVSHLLAPRCAEPQRRPPRQRELFEPVTATLPKKHSPTPQATPWTRLDQALRVTDLLLQGGIPGLS